jgi:hypothetical protein
VERELIADNHFRRGFILWQPKPGKHVRYEELRGSEAKASPVWGLSQWSSKFPFDAPASRAAAGDFLIYSNSAKSITLGRPGMAGADLSLAVNTGVEYGPKARQPGDPWVHLLVEQEFATPAPLGKLNAARFHLEARLLRLRNLHRDDYSPAVHAAQFQVFFTVQNRNRQSPGHGDLLWFGIPVYDNRQRHPPEHKSKDFGGTEKFIFTPDAKTFTAASTHDGEWVVIDKDLLPVMREALATAWAKGFLSRSRLRGDYCIGGMNLGWELPGTFDAEIIFITKGHYWKVPLEGLAVGQFVQSPEHQSMFESFGKWIFDYIYIDEKAFKGVVAAFLFPGRQGARVSLCAEHPPDPRGRTYYDHRQIRRVLRPSD